MKKTVRSILKMRNAMALLLLLAAFGALRAQAVYTMLTNDTVHVYPCLMPSGVIYDNGGMDGNYTNNCESWAILSVPSGVTITLTGDYSTESCCDKIWVYDGQGANGTALVSGVGGTGSINATSTTGWLSIRFHSDGSTVYSGFALAYTISGVASTCTNPVSNLLTSAITDTSAVLTWSASDATGNFLVSVGDTTFTVSDTTVAMDWLNPNTHYDVTIVSTDDNGEVCCMAQNYFRTLCGVMQAPLVEDFDDYGVGEDVLPNCWVRQYNFDATGMYPQVSSTQSYSSPASLMMYCGSNNVGGHWALAIGPEISDDISSLYLRLKMRCSYANAKLEVGVCSDTTLTGNGFVPVDTLSISTGNTWEEKLVSLATYTGTGNRIAFRMIRSLQSANGLSIYIDDLSVEPCGIWHQQRQERNTTEMIIAWDVIGNPTVDIEIGESGFTAGTGMMYSNVTSPYLITGLEPGTEYQIRFYTNCNGITKQQESLTVSTLSRDARAVNFCEGFENNGNNMPNGWQRLNMYSSTPSISTSAAYNSTYGLYYYTSGANRPIAVMPLIDTLNINELMVSFMARSYNYATGRIEIGVMQYPEYASSFVPVDTVEAPLSWVRRTVRLSDYAGAGHYIAFRVYDQNNYSNHLYIDNLEIGPCLVTGQTVTNIASHSVELQWDSVDANWPGDSITVEYDTAGFAAGTGTIIKVPANGINATFSGGKQWLKITGLDTLTAYQFLIYGECTGMTQYCDFVRVNATTLESDPALPLCEGFENYDNGTIPTAWARPTMSSGYPQTSSSGVHTGSRSMQMHAYGNDHSVLAMPMLDVDSVQGLTVSFYSHATHGYGVVEVGVMDNPNDESTFTSVSSEAINNGGYKHHVVTIANYAGSGKYIAFRYTTPNCTYCSYSAYLDDIVVSDAATASNAVYSVTSHGATVSWTGTGRSYSGAEIEWGPTGFQQGTGSKDTVDANTFTYTLDTLDAGETYDVLITALSSETANICNYARNSFTTVLEPMQVSWCYGFEDYNYGQFPASWTRPQTYNGYPIVNSDHHWGERDMLFNSSNNSNTKYNSMAVMPYLEEDTLDDIKLHFYAIGSGSDNRARMVIGMMSNPNDITTFDTIVDTNLYTGGQWKLFEVDLNTYTGLNRHLAFCLCAPSTSGWWSTVHLDDITLSKCYVKNVMSYSPTASSFIVNWTAEGNTDSVELEYGPAGFTPGSGTLVDNATAPYTITGLTVATNYDYYVRPHCEASGSVCAETKYSASTLATPIAANYCEPFDTYNYYELPTAWMPLKKSGSHPFVYYHSDNNYYTSATGALEFHCASAESNLLVMPAAEEALSGLVLSFNMRCSEPLHPERPSLIVGAMSLPYDSTTFVAVDTLHPGWSYKPYYVDFSAYSGTGRHIAFRYYDDGGRYTYIDDLHLSHSIAAGPFATGITNHSATLHWQPISYSDTTWMAFDTIGGNAQMTCLSNLTQVTLDSLLPGTTYQFYFWGEGQDTSLLCQATALRLTTLDAPMVAPYCENFEGYGAETIPAGWTLPYTMQNLQIQNEVFSSNGGNHALRLPAAGGNDIRVSTVVMPAYEGTDLNNLYVDFYLNADGMLMQLTVGVMDDPYDTTTFVAIGQYDVSPGGWKHCKLPLSGYNGTGRYIAFRASSGSTSIQHIYLDDLNLRTCVVTHSSLHNPTENSLTLNWSTSTGAYGVFIEYKATGQNAGDFAAGTGTTLFVSESPYTITGLEEATYYTVHVYPACDTVLDGCNYDILSMQTLHPWVDLPYCENFEEISDPIPNNWVDLSSQSYYLSHGGPSTAHNDSISNYTTLYAYDTNYSMFVLPRIYIGQVCTTIDKMYANFWLNFSGNTSAALFEVGTMTDVNDASTFVPHDTADFIDQGWQHYTLPITNYNTANTYVAFRLSSTDGSGVYCDFDDLCMEKCVASNITVSEITQNSVTITWDNYSVDTLVCEYGPQGFALGSGIVEVITTSPYTITGLSDGTMYDFTFASICGCNQFGASYTPGSGSWGGSGGWGGWGWGWGCCVPCYYDTSLDCRYWRWGQWQGHSWSWWYTHQNGSGNVVYPAIEDVVTQAAMMETPYCELFEMDDTVAFPPSWRRKSESTYPNLTTTNNHSGEKSMRFYATPGNSCYAALPPLEAGDVQQMVLTFYAYSTSNYAVGSNGRFIVGVMSDPDVESTFVPLDTIRLTSVATWEQQVVDLSSYTDSGQYIAFRLKPTGGAYNYFIDDLYVGRCAISDAKLETGPESVLFPGTSSGATSDPYVVKLSWTSNHQPNKILITYGPQGFTPGDSTTVNSLVYYPSWMGIDPYTTQDMEINLTSTYGIDPDSSYDFYITSICSDTGSSCFVSPLTLNPTLRMPYCADFEDLPNEDWQNVALLPSNWKVVRRNAYQPSYPRLEYQEEQNIIAFYPTTGNNDNMVALPPLPDNDSLEGKWVYAYFSTEYNGNPYLEFGAMSDTGDASTFVSMGTMSISSGSTTMKEMNVQLSNGPVAATGNYFALRAACSSGQRWLRLSKLVVSNYPYPTAINDVALGVATHKLSWSGAYSNAYYTIEYGYGNNWQTMTSDSCQAILTGLEPDKEYTVNFISPSGERLCLPYMFINEGYQELPYCENFDSYANITVPTNWYSYSSYGDNYPRTYNDCYKSGPLTLDLYCNSSNTQYTALPDVNVDSIRHLDLNFSLRIESVNNTKLIVGVMDDRTDLSTFTPVDTLTCASNGVHYPQHINLSSYQGTGRYVAFRFLTTNGGRTSIFIDDLVVSPCLLPDFTVYSANTIMANLPEGNEADYYIEYAPNTFIQGEGDTVWNNDSTAYTVTPSATLVHVTENPYYLTGLNASSNYTLYARCDSLVPTCAPPVILRTSDRAPLPYCDDFSSYDDYTLPTGWASYYTNSSSHVYVNSYEEIRFYNYYSNSYTQITLPDVDIDSVRHADIWLDMYSDYASYNYMIVGVMSDRNDMSTFVPVDTLRNSTDGQWQHDFHPRMSRYQGDGRFITFRMQSTSNYRYSYIDNLRIQACPRPTVALVGGTTIQLTVDTTFGAPDYWVEYGVQGTTQMAEDTVWNSDSTQYTLQQQNTLIHVTQTPFLITGLDENSTYDFFTRCDSAEVTCLPVQRVTTSTKLNLSLCYDFSNYSTYDLPPYWRKYNNNPYSYDYPYVYNNYIRFYNYYSYNICQVTLPDLNIDSVKHLNMTFDLQAYNSASDGMIVGVMDNPDDMNTFTPVDTLYCPSTGTWYTREPRMYRYEGSGRFVTFRTMNTGNYRYMYIRDLRIQSCPQATVSLCAGTTVRLDVDTTVSAPDYWVEYGPEGMTLFAEDTVWNTDSSSYTLQPHNTVIHVTQTPYFITGLNAGEIYDFYTRCEQNTSLPDSAINFAALNLSSFTQMTSSTTAPAGNNSFRHVLTTTITNGSDQNCYYRFSSTSSNNYWEFTPRCTGNWALTFNGTHCGNGMFTNTNIGEIVTDPNLNGLTVTYTNLGWLLEFPEEVQCDLRQNNASYTTVYWATLEGSVSASANAPCYPMTAEITASDVMSLPLCYDFSAYPNTTMPSFWRRYTDDTYYTTDPYKYDNALRFRRNYATSVCQAVLPDFNIDSIKNLNLTFSIKGNSLTNGVIVGVMTDPDNPETFVAVDTMHLTVTNEWQQVKPRLNLYNGVGRFVALRELTTGTFYANYFYVESCDIPANVSATLHGHNTVRIDADTTSSTGFWVEYDSAGFAQGTGTYVYCSVLPMDLTLENTTTYDFYFRCDTMNLTCRPKQTVTTMSEPQDLPLCEDFESYTNNTLPTGWQFLHPESSSGSVYVYNNNAHSGSNSLYFKCYYTYHNYAILPDLTVDSLNNLALSFWLKGASGSSLTVGVMSDPTDASSFLPVQTVNCFNDEYVRHLVTLNNLPTDARFLAFRNNIPNGSGYKYIYLDDLFIDTVGAADFRVTNIAADEVTFAWNQVGHPVMNIEYGPVGFTQGTGTTLSITQSPYTVTGLDPLTNHQFYFTSVGDSTGEYCTTNYCDSATIFTPAGGTGCIDPTNFTAEYTTCFYGTYANPIANIGIKDYGSADISSRHTVNYDTTLFDPRTDSLLRIVPEGANASVRLGNWNSSGVGSSAEAEAIAYTLFVDTTSFDLLVLRYAAVLQDPLHDAADQPRFSLEILDTAMMLLDAQCAAADFIANRNLGWNEAPDNVLWKDWTTVGVDLSPYAGQQVIIRLTTRDCAEGNHYGYAYFTVGCQKKNMKSELCGNVDSNTFYAPAGFVYRWYSSTDTLDTISTAQVLKVATDTVYYYCECSFVDNPSCQFTISAYAGTRYPLADFNYTVAISDCQFHVTFTNTSAVSPDGINPLASGEPCESALWDFGNGQASTSYHATMDYDSAGSYTVSLISGIANDECTDTATYVLNLAFPAVNYSIDGLQHLCLGDTTTLAVHETASRLWSTGASDTAITVVPDTTTLYSCFVVDSNGCLDTLTRLVNVYDNSQYEDNQTTVENLLPYTWNNRVYYNDTVDTITLTNIAGCDSTVLFSLHVFFNVADTADSTICESLLPFTWNDSTFTATASKNTLLQASTGADSLLTMNLYVIPTTYETLFDTVIENDLPYTFLSHVFTTDTLGDTLHLVNMAGCDSIITYNLFVHRNVVDTVSDTVCERQLPFVWNSCTFTLDSSYYDTLLSAFIQVDTLTAHTGADSLLSMQLTVIPTTYSTVSDTVVENDLPYAFHHHTYSADTIGDTLHLVNVAGCDSIVTYNLFVYYNVKDTLYDTICESELPFLWNDSTFTASATKTTLLAASSGADSLVTMDLFVIPTTYDTVNDTIIENDLPRTFLTHTYYTDTVGDTLLLVNAAGCDSIVTYNLFVHRNVFDTVTDTLCESLLPYVWNNRTFSLDSSYFDTLLAAFVQLDTLLATTGADSLLTMQLVVIPTTYADISDTVLESQLPHTFNGVSYTHDLFESDSNFFATLDDTLTLTNVAGCDSIVYYHLSIHLNKTVTLDSAVCATELPVQWNARTFTLDSSYFDTLSATFVQQDTLLASTGTDSILIMQLTVHEVYHWKDTLVVCRNQLPYTWRDTVLMDSTQSGDYFLARVSQYGCDSLMSLNLTIGEIYAFYDTMSVCFDAQPVTWLDTSVSDSVAGTLDVVLPRATVLGCDSLYNLSLTLRPVYDIHDTVTLCENSLPYTWADTSVAQGSSSCTIERLFTSSVLCDSLRTLHLTVDTNTFSTVHEYVIENNLPYTYHGYTFNDDTAGVVLVFENQHGCDSTVTYSLTVYHNVSTQVEATVCDDALPYQWNSQTFDTNDVATFGSTITKNDTLLAYTGADSVVIMTLHVNPTYSKVETFGICYDALPYTWHDTLLGTDQTSGTLERHFLTLQGCDSSFTLNLTVSDVYNVTDNISSCVPITWIDGVTYETATSGPQVTLQSQAGCDSIVTLNFTIIPPVYTNLADSFCVGDVYHFAGQDLTTGGLFIDSLLTVDNCDSIVSLQLTMLALPQLTLTADPECQTYTYNLKAETNVDYLKWTVEPGSWNNDWGQPTSHLLYVRPYGTQTFTATVDYLEQPTCPVTKTISLSPIVQPLAIINVKPERLNYEQHTLVALDQSTGAIWRKWWVNGDDFGDEVRIEFTPDMQEDSVVLMLEVGSQYCTDTAIQIVPIFRNSVYAPNAFTPGENSNKVFFLLLDGILEYELTIYNRQGIEVFHSLDPEMGWDGTSAGHLCPQGAYVWILRYTTKEMPRVPQTAKGSVLLLR